MKSIKILGIFLITILLLGCTNKTEKEKTYDIAITIKDYGTIYATLNATQAPITVKNFLKLVDEKFYDGLTFHRVVKDFMIQGGDPKGNGTGGSEETILGEFANNGVNNTLSHTRGAISMARNGIDNNSASSQFFIVHKDSTYLDGDYAVFGYVTKGMEIVDQICEKTKVEEDGETVAKENQPIIESIRRISKKNEQAD